MFATKRDLVDFEHRTGFDDKPIKHAKAPWLLKRVRTPSEPVIKAWYWVAMSKLNFESVAPNVKVLRLEEEVVTEALKAIDRGPPPSPYSLLFSPRHQ